MMMSDDSVRKVNIEWDDATDKWVATSGYYTGYGQTQATALLDLKMCTEELHFTFEPITVDIIQPKNEVDIITKLGYTASVAYQSEPDYPTLLNHCMKKGHESVLEHESITLSIVCDRATAYALIRHRHTALTQESTIYCSYKNKIRLIEPAIYEDAIYESMAEAYINDPRPAKLKRDILPNVLKTQLVMTTNIREWRYILGLRMDPKDSTRMHTVITLINDLLKRKYPFFFENIKQQWA